MVDNKEKVKLVLESAQDPASVSISAFLQEQLSFSPTENSSLLKAGEIYLLKTDKKHLYFDNIDEEISNLGLNIETLIFLSKHSSQAKINSLTVHSTGNFSEAILGGKPGQLSFTDPGNMTSALRIMNQLPVKDFSITFEATHHGPLTMIPSFFIEIGTEPKDWENRDALQTVTQAVIKCRDNGEGGFIGIGGGHYSPKITEYALKNSINVGHIIPKHNHENLNPSLLKQAAERTRSFRGILMDKKGTRGPVREIVKNFTDEISCELIVI
jgi:D-aminoacyl-tRNA deacylase